MILLRHTRTLLNLFHRRATDEDSLLVALDMSFQHGFAFQGLTQSHYAPPDAPGEKLLTVVFI